MSCLQGHPLRPSTTLSYVSFKPTRDDRAGTLVWQLLTIQDFRRCTALIGTVVPSRQAARAEITTAKNVQRGLAQKVQDVSAQFRKKQRVYMQSRWPQSFIATGTGEKPPLYCFSPNFAHDTNTQNFKVTRSKIKTSLLRAGQSRSKARMCSTSCKRTNERYVHSPPHVDLNERFYFLLSTSDVATDPSPKINSSLNHKQLLPSTSISTLVPPRSPK